MALENDVVHILQSVLGLRKLSMERQQALLGAVPEFDSMAVVNLITALEERFGILFEDDEVTAELFETVGTVCDALERKLNGG